MSQDKPIDLEADDDYRESDDEDYNPDAPGADQAFGDASDDDSAELKRLNANYAQFQGRGGLIKTRAQRRQEAEDRANGKIEKPVVAPVGESSVDVDALWSEMNAKPSQPTKEAEVATKAEETTKSEDPKAELKADPAEPAEAQQPQQQPQQPDSEYITITRTYKFAGSVKTETKDVLKTSAEGQDFLREQKLKSQGRGPVKRKMSLMEEYQANKTKKINTLEKSRLDWLGFVDKEGIREDLTKFNKAGYLDKREFLDRVDTKREQDIRQQRAKELQ